MAKIRDKNFIELIKGGSISFVLRVVGMIIGYTIMIFITNKFGAEGYGEYILTLTVLGIVLVFSKFGIDISIVRILGEIKLSASKKDIINILIRIFLITLIISVILMLILFMFSNEITEYVFGNTDFAESLNKIAFLIIPATFILLVAGYFQAYKKTFLYILFNTFLLNFVLLGALFLFELTNVNYKPFYLYSIAVCITFCVAFFMLIKDVYLKENYKTVKVVKKFTFPEIINLSFPMLLAGSFVLFINWSDIIMLSIFSKEKDIGIYNASQRIAEISSIALFAVNAIATPKFAEFFSKKDMKGLENTVVKSTKLISLISLPILIVIIFFPKTILSINGNEFVLGYMALIFLCIGKFFNSIAGSVGYILQMTNNQNIFRNVMIFAAVLNVTLNYFLIPKFNYNGAAFASMLTVIVWNIILVFIIKKRLGFWTFYNPYKDIKGVINKMKS